MDGADLPSHGGTCASKKHGVMFEPWAQNPKSNLFFQNLYISGWETFLMKTKSLQTKNTHISVVHESSSTDIWGFGKMHELIKSILPKVVISVDGKQFLCKTKSVQTHT